MQRILVLAVLLGFSPAVATAEKKVTYDLVSFSPPAPIKKKKWVRDLKKDKNSTSYTLQNKDDRTYCQIFVIKSTTSQGDLDTDFATEWKNLVAPSGVKDPAQTTDPVEDNGWKAKGGVAAFPHDGGTSIAILTTMTGYDRMVSIVAMTNSEDYLPALQSFLESVEMQKPPVAKVASKPAAKTAAKPQALQGYMEYSPFTKTWTWKVRYPPQ